MEEEEREDEETQEGEGESGSSSSSRQSQGSCTERDEVPPEEMVQLSAKKTMQVIQDAEDSKWRQNIREQMETELEQRVREALCTPPIERINKRRQLAQQQDMARVDLNAHLLLGLSDKEQKDLRTRRWRALQAHNNAVMNYLPSRNSQMEFIFRDQLSKSNQDQFPGVFGLDSFSEGFKNIREDYSNVVNRYGAKFKSRHFYTKEGFLKCLKSGNLPPGVRESGGKYVDKYGVERTDDGPFWPVECVPLFPTPRFQWESGEAEELLYIHLPR